MNQKPKQRMRLLLGLAVGGLFIFLAFRKTALGEVWTALQGARYGMLVPAVGLIFLSHLLRARRWAYLLHPIKPCGTPALFSALMIGYMANALLPAHLGEFLRALVLSRKQRLAMAAVFATIVVERVIDMFSLFFLMLVSLFVYSFPPWVTRSGYLMLAGTVALLILLVMLKRRPGPTLDILHALARPVPHKIRTRLLEAAARFVEGLTPLSRRRDIVFVALLSLAIWVCYGLVFTLCLEAFDFHRAYDLPWSASLILLVITTISIVVPSSPGYVGAYHYLCQLTLGLFDVPPGPALSFAVVAHAINIVPVLVVGLVLAQVEGVALTQSRAESIGEPGAEAGSS